jgi:hypothetical protein
LNLPGSHSDTGQGFYFFALESLIMPTAIRISAPIPASTISPASTTSSEKSETHPLVPVALFSGIGLLISLVAVLCGVQGVWF